MLGWLLNFVYLGLLVALAPWLACTALRTGKYRQGWAEKFAGRGPWRRGRRPCVWLHAVSVGEVKLLQPLLAELARRRPDVECVVSTTTRSGHELAAKLYPDLLRFYCPLDFTWAVAAAMRRIRPELLVLCELELWPNLVRGAKASGARVAVVNGRLSERSFRGYRRIRPLLAALLGSLDLVAVQNDEYARRFLSLGAPRAALEVTGSLKFDGAVADRDNPRTAALRALAGWDHDAVVFLAGSTQSPEESLALSTFAALRAEYPRLRLILVPRHPERFDEVARLLDSCGLPWGRRSQLPAVPITNAAPSNYPASIRNPSADFTTKNGGQARPLNIGSEFRIPNSEFRIPPPILLVDTIGELAAWWGLATVAFVGGSMGPRGGQNMLEPAAYGAAVSFGSNTRNFRDVVEMLLTRQAAVVVRDAVELTEFVRRCLAEPQYAEELGRRAAALVAEGRGATGRTAARLLELLPAAAAEESRAA